MASCVYTTLICCEIKHPSDDFSELVFSTSGTAVVQKETRDASIERRERDLSRATLFVVCSPWQSRETRLRNLAQGVCHPNGCTYGTQYRYDMPRMKNIITRVNAPPPGPTSRARYLVSSRARRMSAPKRVALDRPRPGMPENVSFGVGAFFVAELSSSRSRSWGGGSVYSYSHGIYKQTSQQQQQQHRECSLPFLLLLVTTM